MSTRTRAHGRWHFMSLMKDFLLVPSVSVRVNFSLRDGASFPHAEHIDGMAVLTLRGIPYGRYSSYFLVLGFLVGRVSRSRLSTSSRPRLLPCTILLFSTKSSCASMAWGSTVFGVAWLVNSFEARKVVLWLLESCQQTRTGWCCVVSTRLKPRGLAKPPRVSPMHV